MLRRMRALRVDVRSVLRESLIAALEELAPIDIVATSDSETRAMSDQWISSFELSA